MSFECQLAFVNTAIDTDTSDQLTMQDVSSFCGSSDELVTLICFSPLLAESTRQKPSHVALANSSRH